MSYNLESTITSYRAGEVLRLPSFLEEILEELQEKIGCEAGSILLLEDESQKLIFKVTTGARRGDIKKLTVDTKEGVAGWVFQKGKSLIVNNTHLAVPLKLGDKVVGVMELINKKEGNFTQEDLNIVLSFASIAAVVVENIELYKHLRILVNRVNNLENYQKVLLESLTDGVLSINPAGEVVSCNRSIQIMLNRDRESIVGQNISELFNDKNTIKDIIEGCRKKGKINGLFSYLKTSKKNRFPVAVDASSLIYDSKNKGIVIVVRNLRDALLLEEIKREIIVRSDLACNLSHEFMTPLTAIQAGIQIFKENFEENGQSKYIEIVDNSVEILKERIQTFLDYLKAEKDEWKVNLESIRLNLLLKQIIEEYKQKFPRYKFILSLPNSPVFIYADKKQTKKVLGVILKNAIQYSKEGSRIQIRAVSNEEFINLYIKDQGRGISEKNVKNLFDKFKRFCDPLKETSSGFGIELWLAKYLLKKNNADIIVQSKEGEGTVVKLSFKKGGEL